MVILQRVDGGAPGVMVLLLIAVDRRVHSSNVVRRDIGRQPPARCGNAKEIREAHYNLGKQTFRRDLFGRVTPS